ncbi:DUF3179 domain-containing protein [Nitrososphaera sp.]|uniref:DUF3179 domain-containing protein n=1 Tax=Nitrososphaera sp. TaxID=1971748 RepID=UPI00307EFE4C
MQRKTSIFVIAGGIAVAITIIIIAAATVAGTGSFVADAPAGQVQRQGPAATATGNFIVPPEKIVSGGPPRDGIPSIDSPKFTSASGAGLEDGDLVIGLAIEGDAKAYPLKILVWHEIVNDVVGGEPVAVTYCPLCFTSQVFKRTLSGDESSAAAEFGTSGKLYNSNLVMYDRSTESLWSQALGQAIAGERAGERLERVPFDLAQWGDWKRLYPQSRVLSQDTGFDRPYGSDPYGNYYTSPEIYFPVENRDGRLGPKEVVVGFESNGVYRAYPLQKIENEHVINDSIGSSDGDRLSVLLVSQYPFMTRAFDRELDGGGWQQVLKFDYKDGKVTDRQTASTWDVEGVATDGPMKGAKLKRLPFDIGFWFEWAAFHPGTELFR